MTWYVVNRLITDNYQHALKWANEAAHETQKVKHAKKQAPFHQNSKQDALQKR